VLFSSPSLAVPLVLPMVSLETYVQLVLLENTLLSRLSPTLNVPLVPLVRLRTLLELLLVTRVLLVHTQQELLVH